MKYILITSAWIMILATCTHAQRAKSDWDPKLTEVWEPVPEVVRPGKNGQPPSDAIILFDGEHLDNWGMAPRGNRMNILNTEKEDRTTGPA